VLFCQLLEQKLTKQHCCFKWLVERSTVLKASQPGSRWNNDDACKVA
jgi:hypothetical protein